MDEEEEAIEQIAPEVEQRARDLGWRPPDEWQGDPPRGGFKTAVEYLERGEEVLAITKANNRKLETANRELRSEIDKVKTDSAKTIKNLDRMSAVALKNQREQLIAQYEHVKEQAVEVGDKAAYNDAKTAERAALKEFDESIAEKPDEEDKKPKLPTLPPKVAETIAEWEADNAWYGKDKVLTKAAEGYHEELTEDKPGLSLAENLQAVTKFIRKKFPEKFTVDDDDDPPRRNGSAVEGGSRISPRGGAWSKLPEDARRQADKFIKEDGLFLEKGETVEKNMPAARERYAKQYFELGE